MVAVRNVEKVICPALIDAKFDVARDLKSIHAQTRELNGSKNKGNLRANAILGVKIASRTEDPILEKFKIHFDRSTLTCASCHCRRRALCPGIFVNSVCTTL